jgi:hypothetical protein
MAAPAFAASIAAAAIAAGVTGTLSDRPTVSPAPVTAQVMNTSRAMDSGTVSSQRVLGEESAPEIAAL